MPRIFKSNKILMTRNFLSPLCLAAALVYLPCLLAGAGKGVIIGLIAAAPVLISLSAYSAFFRHNVKVEVSDRGVEFIGTVLVEDKRAKMFRRSKKHRDLKLSSDEYVFTSNVESFSYNGIPIMVSRQLRAVAKEDGVQKDCRCFSFTKRDFAQMMSVASALKFRSPDDPDFRREQINEEFQMNDVTAIVNEREDNIAVYVKYPKKGGLVTSDTFRISQIAEIRATPLGYYEQAHKRLLISDNETKREYRLKNIHARNQEASDEYGGFCLTLELLFSDKPGVFSYYLD